MGRALFEYMDYCLRRAIITTTLTLFFIAALIYLVIQT